jgi:GTP-binding protein
MSSTPRVLFIGRPNAGKSSLFNALIEKKYAITNEKEHTTRDYLEYSINYQDREIILVDSPGLGFIANNDKNKSITTLAQTKAKDLLNHANFILYCIDINGSIIEEDRLLINLIRRSHTPFMIVATKKDLKNNVELNGLAKLGGEDIFAISTKDYSSISEIKNYIFNYLFPNPESPAVDSGKSISKHRISIIGRPNTGKSTLLNYLSSSPRALVSDKAGTTRDVLTVNVNYVWGSFDISDTAGVRRNRVLKDKIDFYANERLKMAIKDSDICIFLIDALEIVTNIDQTLAGDLIKSGKPFIVLVNKIDAVTDKTISRLERILSKNYQFAWWAVVLFISAIEGFDQKNLFAMMEKILINYNQDIDNKKLEQLVRSIRSNHIFSTSKGLTVKIDRIEQQNSSPVFKLYGKNVDKLNFSAIRNLENRIRDFADYTGCPIHIITNHRNKKDDKKNKK